MTDLMQYLLEANIALIVILSLYIILFKRFTFHKWNRLYLTGGIIFISIVPLFDFQMGQSQSLMPLYGLGDFMVLPQQPGIINNVQVSPGPMDWILVILAIYLLGVIISVIIYGIKLIKLIKLIRILPFEDNIALQGHLPTFSFFNWIIINTQSVSEKEIKDILRHEKAHGIQLHSLDLILMDITRIVFWFNPLLGIYRNQILQNHEYLADESVTEKEDNSNLRYSALIVRQACLAGELPSIIRGNSQLIHSFSKSQIKRRILMINRTKSKRNLKWLYLLVIPLAFALFNTTACNRGQSSDVALIKALAPQTFEEGAKPEKDPDNWPEFPGGQEGLFKYLGTIKYPKKAEKEKIEAKFYLEFIIGKDGSIESCEWVPAGEKPPEILLTAAIGHVLKMPVWTPGDKDGKPVMVKMTLPFNFLLSPEKKD